MQVFHLAAVLFAAGSPAATPTLIVDIHLPAPAPTKAPTRPGNGALELFQTRCATCHGVAGKGDGPAAAGLMKTPRRFSDAVWQASVDDDAIAKTILQGGYAVKKSAAMPANPDLQPRVRDLVQVVRSFRCAHGTVVVDVLGADGKVVASDDVDLDARGNARFKAQKLTPGAYSVVARTSASGAPLCEARLQVTATPATTVCAPPSRAEPKPTP